MANSSIKIDKEKEKKKFYSKYKQSKYLLYKYF